MAAHLYVRTGYVTNVIANFLVNGVAQSATGSLGFINTGNLDTADGSGVMVIFCFVTNGTIFMTEIIEVVARDQLQIQSAPINNSFYVTTMASTGSFNINIKKIN